MDCPSCGVNVAQAATIDESESLTKVFDLGNVKLDAHKFCGQCGAELPRACAACGSSNPADAKFCSECGASLSPVSPLEAATSPSLAAKVSPTSSAERRQVTIMFCDMVGSTALSTKFD